ncbi:MAG: c-type cytochrome, partial [Pirellulales bacterium]
MTRITPITSILLVLTVAAIADDNPQVLQDATIVETLLRLEDFDLSSSEKAKATVERYLQRERGSERYFELIQKFKIKSAGEDLVALAAERPDETAGVRAVQVLIDHDQAALLASAINDEDEARAADLIAAMGRLGNPKVEQILSLVFADQKRSLAVRSAAARALGRSTQGQKDFLKLAAAGELPDDLKFTVADLLFASNHESIRSEAAKYLRPPASADETPLPPVGLLIKRRGDPEKGKEIFAKKGACAKCHQVGDEGRNVGPALTEIGGKLAKESMYVAIL